jgi:hypothetical protein
MIGAAGYSETSLRLYQIRSYHLHVNPNINLTLSTLRDKLMWITLKKLGTSLVNFLFFGCICKTAKSDC